MEVSRTGGATGARRPTLFVSADWAKHPGKRSVHVADLSSRKIRRERSTGWDLRSLIDLARELSGQRRPVLVGIDAALGVPQCYWQELGKLGIRARTFRQWLESIDDDDFFETVRSPEDWRVDRPFFHVPKGRGGRASFERLLPNGFKREIDRRTGSNPLFAVSGIPGSVGSATRELWRELIGMSSEVQDVALWPFDGGLVELLNDQRVVLAETYPRLAYAAALAPTLPSGRISIAKTKRPARDEACRRLEIAFWVLANGVDLGDLDSARQGEDAFDSLLTAAAVLRCTVDDLPLVDPEWVDPVAEGGMLLAGVVDPGRKAENLVYRSARSLPLEHVRGREEVPSIARKFRCPIPGCTKVFEAGRGGWDAHVGSWRQHPYWQPRLRDPDVRKRRFKAEFSSWFG